MSVAPKPAAGQRPPPGQGSSLVSASLREIARAHVGPTAPVGASERFAVDRLWHAGRTSRHTEAKWKQERLDDFKRLALPMGKQVAMVLSFPLVTYAIGMSPFAIPTQPASEPVDKQWTYVAALVWSAFLMFFAPMEVMRKLTQLKAKALQQIAISALSALLFGAIIVVVGQFVFPVPFTTVVFLLPPFALCVALSFFALPKRLRQVAQIRHSVFNAAVAVALLLCFITLWAIVCLLFMRLRVMPELQAVLALTIPVTKFFVRKLFTRHSAKTDSDNAAVYCMLVEYFSSTFVSILLGGAAPATTIILVSSDFVVNALHIFDICAPDKSQAFWKFVCPCCKRQSPRVMNDNEVMRTLGISVADATIMEEGTHADVDDDTTEVKEFTQIVAFDDDTTNGQAPVTKTRQRRLSRVEVYSMVSEERRQLKIIASEHELLRQCEVLMLTEYVEVFVPMQYMLLMLFARFAYNPHMFPMVGMLKGDRYWDTLYTIGIMVAIDLVVAAASIVAVKCTQKISLWRVMAFGLYDHFWFITTHVVLLWIFVVWLGVKHARADFSLGGAI